MNADRYTDGMRVRREVLGDAHVDRAIDRTTEFTEDFQRLITEYAWGSVWRRDGIDRRTRSVATLTALLAMRNWEEFEMHVRAARTNGLSADEIGEVILNSAVYCGVPIANRGFAIAHQVLDGIAEADGRTADDHRVDQRGGSEGSLKS